MSKYVSQPRNFGTLGIPDGLAGLGQVAAVAKTSAAGIIGDRETVGVAKPTETQSVLNSIVGALNPLTSAGAQIYAATLAAKAVGRPQMTATPVVIQAGANNTGLILAVVGGVAVLGVIMFMATRK